MKDKAKFALVLFAGMLLGAGAVQGLHAQSGGKKPAFVIAEVNVKDPAGYKAYLAKVPASLAPYHSRIVAAAKPDVKEGAPAQGNIVMATFDSLADAEKWYSTPPYSELIPLRQKAADTRLLIVEGLPQ